MVEFIVEILKNTITTVFGRGISTLKAKIDLDAFLKEINEWLNCYVKRNEHTVIASSVFFNYIRYYNLIENIISFIQSPIKRTEDSFLQEYHDNAIEYIESKESKKSLTPEDSRCVKEFIAGVLEKTKNYYDSKISVEDTSFHYHLIQANAKLDEMGSDIRDIKALITPPKPILLKKIYRVPQNTIIRNFALYKDIQESLFLSLHTKNMLDACLNEKHIVLLGEAGCGKSIALDQLSAMVSDTEYYPLRYNLNNYTGETIDQIINEPYSGIDIAKLFLIFDAYDEIEKKNRKDFARKLSKFVIDNPETIILVSSRNNFYKFSDDDGNGGLFETFKEYGIAPITEADIVRYVRNNGIDSAEFFDEVNKNELNNLVFVPFYLCELLRIYQRNSSLPSKSNIMEEIIRNRFDKDCQKYARTNDLEDFEVEMFSCLEKLAFAIQCLHTVKISNEDYQKLFNAKQRELIKYSGVFSKDENNYWSFEHNNFREYLTAKYINQLDISEIKQLICTPQGKVIDSWLNVLSFLVLIREDDDLLQLLMENDPEMLVRFEKSRIDESSRSNIVISILNGLAERNLWISWGINSSDIIARFGQSKKVCEFLLDQIARPVNFRAQSNALIVLSEFTNLYGMNEKTQCVLFNCLKSEEVRYYEKYRVLNAIVSLKLQNTEITSYIVENFNHNIDAFYRLGVLQYLHRSDLYEEYIDLFIEEYKITCNDLDDGVSIDHEVMNVFAKVKHCNALCKIIVLLANDSFTYSMDEEKYDSIISNAVETYNDGNAEIFDTIVATLPETEIKNHALFERSITFFEKTNTKTAAFMKLVDMDLELETNNVFFALMKMGDSDCYMVLLSEYKKDSAKYENIVRRLALRFNEDSPLFVCYRDTLNKNGVALPPRRPTYDWEKARQRGRQYYFDCLFEKEKYCALVEKLVTSIGNKKITFSELDKADYSPINYDGTSNNMEEYALLELYYSLIRSFKDDKVVIDTIIGIQDWKQYIIYKSYKLLKTNRNIEITEEKKILFEEYCNEQLKEIDFQNDVHENENNTLSFSRRLILFIFFSVFFDFKYEKDTYLKMLLVPYYLFETDNLNHSKFPSYVVSRLTESELESQVKYNLANERMCSDVVDMHIRFCEEKNLDFGVSAAENICADETSDSWRKYNCIKYLEQIKGHSYIYDKFLDTEDETLIEKIVYVTAKYKDARLKERLESLNKASQDKRAYLSTLILLNSQYGLKQYYEIAKSEMKSTNITEKTNIDSTVEAIAAVNDINLLNDLGDLRILLFTPGFEDKEDFGLYSSLYKAYKNLANIDCFKVKDHLEACLKKENISDNEKHFCNSLLQDIEQICTRSFDVKWTIKDIKDFWIAHDYAV